MKERTSRVVQMILYYYVRLFDSTMKNIKAFFKKAKKENAYIFPRLFQFIFQKTYF